MTEIKKFAFYRIKNFADLAENYSYGIDFLALKTGVSKQVIQDLMNDRPVRGVDALKLLKYIKLNNLSSGIKEINEYLIE